MTAQAILERARVLPVLVIEQEGDALPLAEALAAGGLTTIEVTLRTPAALGAIRAIAKALPELAVGAGTVLARRDLEAAFEAGASFAVSPGATPALLDAARSLRLPFVPGVATASDIMAAREAGFHALKFFPAEASGGVAALAALAGPFHDVRFCPTGGITAAGAAAWRSLRQVICVGGSWMAPADAIRAGDWERILDLARQSLEQ